MVRLIAYCRLIPIVFSTILKIKKQQKFVKKELLPILDKYSKDNSISTFDVYKMVHYYSLGVAVLLGDYFCILRGKGITNKERKALTFMAAISTMYDDFFDKTNHTKERIESMTYDPKAFQAEGFREKLFNELTLKSLDSIGLLDLLNGTRQEVLEIQWRTKFQNEKSYFTWEELKMNTMNKGGWSFLFYRSAMGNSISQEEKEIIFQIGGLLQYSNDIFDAYKDREEGIWTQVNSVNDILIVEADYAKEMDKTFKMCNDSSYSNSIKKEFLKNLKLLCARTLVCMDQFKEVQKNHQGLFPMKELTRQELVCDMEKPVNLIRMARRYVTLVLNK